MRVGYIVHVHLYDKFLYSCISGISDSTTYKHDLNNTTEYIT